MATTTLDELIEQTRFKANVTRSNFATDPEIIGYLNEAGKQLRELIISADDSYYQSVLDFSISAMPNNVTALPAAFWKMRGLDAFAGDSLRQTEVYAREYRNRFDPGIGYYFGGDGNSLVVCGSSPERGNPFRLSYVPKPIPLAAVSGITRTLVTVGGDGTNAGEQLILANAQFGNGDVGAAITLTGSDSPLDGTRTILTVVSPTVVTTLPAMPSSQSATVGTAVTIVTSPAATRSFAVTPAGLGDSQQSGYWLLQNAIFGPSDVGAFLTTDVGGTTYDGTFEIIQYVSPTTVQVTPAIAGSSGVLTGTASISRQPAGTRSSLDLTEDNFAEYYSVRAAMTIARKKRQDSLVAALGQERGQIEQRIASLSRMRQSEPQQAPVLWGRRSLYEDDLDV